MQKSVLNLIVVCACGGRVPDCHRRRGERTPMLDVLRWGKRERGVPVARALLRSCAALAAAERHLRLAREMGITLVTARQIERLGRRLNLGAKPVGTGCFGARFSPAKFYVLECQTKEENA
jgi:hypothetical protein